MWALIEAWSKSGTDDQPKAVLRERIRRFALTRCGQRRGLKAATKDRAREAYAILEPIDPVVRHAWLFAKQWVEVSADEMEAETIDFSRREERVDTLRAEAMQEIWAKRGFEGVITLLSRSESPYTVGWYASPCVTGPMPRAEFGVLSASLRELT